MNQCLFVGRMCYKPELVHLENGKTTMNITLAVTRPFRNSVTDEFDTDFIKITVWDGLADTVAKYTDKGSMLCVKARAVPKVREVENTKIGVVDFVGEMINFVSNKKSVEEISNTEKV